MKLFDTHCHLNFKAFSQNLETIIADAKSIGVDNILIPGTDIVSSRKAIQIARGFDFVFAAVGIHPHHIYEYHRYEGADHLASLERDLSEIATLLHSEKVVAVGEVGIDRYYYRDTKYSTYVIDEKFVDLQKIALVHQLRFASDFDKSLILHNRLAKEDLLDVLDKNWNNKLRYRTVFHCCEADDGLLDFAIKHDIFIGVDGDITFSKKKKRFVKKIPLELLVLETDSPYLTPRPLRDDEASRWPNTPVNLPITAEYVAKALNIDAERLAKITTENAMRLFGIVS